MITPDSSGASLFLSGPEWLDRPFEGERGEFLIGTPEQPLVRPHTKNLIEAGDKSFKTTMLLRFALGMAAAVSVYPQLPVAPRQLRVLYVHGELSPAEIEDRTVAAATGIPRESLTGFIQGRDLAAHLIRPSGQNVIHELLAEHTPSVLALDPWQSFISGYDENSFRDISQATKFIDSLIETYSVTVFIPIHTGKDEARGARGSSTLAGWRDTLFRMIPNRAKDGDGNRVIESVKLVVEPRWAAPPPPFKLKFRDGTMWAEDLFSPSAQKVRDFVETHGGRVSKEQLRESAPWNSMKADAFRQTLHRAQDEGAITIIGTDTLRLP